MQGTRSRTGCLIARLAFGPDLNQTAWSAKKCPGAGESTGPRTSSVECERLELLPTSSMEDTGRAAPARGAGVPVLRCFADGSTWPAAAGLSPAREPAGFTDLEDR